MNHWYTRFFVLFLLVSSLLALAAPTIAQSADIPPAMQWNTFLGGGGYEEGQNIAVDKNRNIYVAGVSSATWGTPIIPYGGGGRNIFVAKLDSNGNLIWNTFLGINTSESGIVIDENGYIYVMGIGDSTWGSPVRPYNYNGDPQWDVFVAKLDSNGNLIWNTFLGGFEYELGHGIALDGNGNVYVAGRSFGTWGSPVSPFVDNTGHADAFAAKLDGCGSFRTTLKSNYNK